jgi:predicted dehydrogenase
MSPENNSTDSMKVGISGLGNLGYDSMESIEQDIEGVETAAVMDIDEVAFDDIEEDSDIDQFLDYEEMISRDDLDSVIITTPHSLHYEQAKMALEEGKDVFIEKPFTVEPESAAKLADLADEKGLELGIGVQKRSQHYGPMKDIIASGGIGKVESVEASLEQEWLDADHGWRLNHELSGGGNLMDSGYHLVDGVLYATNGEPVEVDAEMNWSEIKGIETDANLDVKLDIESEGVDGGRIDDQVSAEMYVSGECHGPYEWKEQVMIEGSKADLKWSHIVYHDERGDQRRLELIDDEGTEIYFPDRNPTTAKLEDFFESVRNGSKPVADAYDSLDQVSLIRSAYQSEEAGEPVSVETDPKALVDESY